MRRIFSNGLMRLGLLLIALSALTACVQTTGSSATEKALCRSFRPILWSGGDTDRTIHEVKAHNAVGVALCGWKGR